MNRDTFVYAEALTASDTVDATHVIEQIFCGGAGNIVAVLMDGSTVILTACLAGTIYPVRCRRINSTSTTASNLVGLGDKVRTVEALGAGQTIGL